MSGVKASSVTKRPWKYDLCCCGKYKCKGNERCIECLLSLRNPVTQPDDQSIRHIPLTKGQVAIVDAADYEWLNRSRWQAIWSNKTQSFYAKRDVTTGGKRKQLLMHRAILGLGFGDVNEGDHINGNTLDYRRSNLRVATHGQNGSNRGKNANNKSGLKGVHWSERDKKWIAQIMHDQKRYRLGGFDKSELAYAAYCEAATRLHGEFARFA